MASAAPATHHLTRTSRCTSTIAALGATLLHTACGAEPPAGTDARVAVFDSAGVEVVRNHDRHADTLSMTIVETLRIGAAGANDEETFYLIRGLVTDDAGRIFVIDDGAGVIRLFDADGRFVRRIGSRGSGPGEFERINLLTRWQDTLHAIDPTRWVGTFFDTAGTVLGTYRSLRADMTVLQIIAAGPAGWYASDDSPYLRPPLELGAEQRYVQSLRRIDPRLLDEAMASAAAADTLAPHVVSYQWGRSFGFLGSEGGSERGVFGSSPLFDPRATRAVDGRGHIYIAPGWPLVVDVYDPHGAHIRRISRAHDTIPVTDALVGAVLQRARTHYDTLGGRGASLMNSMNERAKMPRVGFVPAVTTVRVSGGGWLWLRRRDLEPDPVLLEWSTGSPPPPAYWDVFDPDGRYRYTLRMPHRFVPHAVAADHVVGVQRDEWDVETIVRYAIRPA